MPIRDWARYKPTISDETCVKIAKLYLEGNSMRDIAKTLGIGSTMVERVLKYKAVPARDRTEVFKMFLEKRGPLDHHAL